MDYKYLINKINTQEVHIQNLTSLIHEMCSQIEYLRKIIKQYETRSLGPIINKKNDTWFVKKRRLNVKSTSNI